MLPLHKTEQQASRKVVILARSIRIRLQDLNFSSSSFSPGVKRRMEDGIDWKVRSDWYSPRRLHDSPVEYDFPGDRFIPNRSLMDLDQARGALTNRTSKGQAEESVSKTEYRRKLQKLTLDAEGRPFQMLVFRGSPKSLRKSGRLIDAMRQSDEELLSHKPPRQFPKSPTRTLDAPNMRNDFYLNIIDWGRKNVIAVALGSQLFLWNEDNREIELLSEERSNEYPSSVAWSEDAKTIAVGYSCSRIQLYDPESLRTVRCLTSHNRRVVSITWNGHILTSGSSDRSIINHDVRARNSTVCHIKQHKGEICGLKWSSTGRTLASGGNDNLVYIWDVSKMSSKQYVHRFNEHCAAVKALAWCPFEDNLLASGGGTSDGSLRIWDIQKGKCINSLDTGAQICGLQWNSHHKEILSAHGFGNDSSNKLCLWMYPSMNKIGESPRQQARVLHLSQSPDGLSVVSAGEDETLRFWDVFGPVTKCRRSTSNLDNLLSLRESPLR